MISGFGDPQKRKSYPKYYPFFTPKTGYQKLESDTSQKSSQTVPRYGTEGGICLNMLYLLIFTLNRPTYTPLEDIYMGYYGCVFRLVYQI